MIALTLSYTFTQLLSALWKIKEERYGLKNPKIFVEISKDFSKKELARGIPWL